MPFYTLKPLKQYDYKFIKVSRAMNIKVHALHSWYKKEINNIRLLTKTRNKKRKDENIKKQKYSSIEIALSVFIVLFSIFSFYLRIFL